MTTLRSIYEEETDARVISGQVSIDGNVLTLNFFRNISYSFAMGTVPTCSLEMDNPLPGFMEENARVIVSIGFNGYIAQVFNGTIESISVRDDGCTVACTGNSKNLDIGFKRTLLTLDNVDASDAVSSLLDAAGIANYVVNLPAWTLGVPAQDLEFQSYAEAINKIAEVDGSPLYELPSGQVRVEVRDPVPGPSAFRQYFTGDWSSGSYAIPAAVTNSNAQPRIRRITRERLTGDVRNNIIVRGQVQTTTGPTGETNEDAIEVDTFAVSPWISNPPQYIDFIFENDLIQTSAKALTVAQRYYLLKSRLYEQINLTVDGDPEIFLGATVGLIDPTFTNIQANYVVQSYTTSLSVDNFETSLVVMGGISSGIAPQIAPVADFTWSLTGKIEQVTPSSGRGILVTFDGSPSLDFDGTIASYAWTDSEGGSGSGQYYTTAYDPASVSSVDVTLTVTDNDGNTDAITKTVQLISDDSTIGGGELQKVFMFAAAGDYMMGSQDGGQTWTDQSAAAVSATGTFIDVCSRYVSTDISDDGVAAFFLTTAGEVYLTLDVCATVTKLISIGGTQWTSIMNLRGLPVPAVMVGYGASSIMYIIYNVQDDWSGDWTWTVPVLTSPIGNVVRLHGNEQEGLYSSIEATLANQVKNARITTSTGGSTSSAPSGPTLESSTPDSGGGGGSTSMLGGSGGTTSNAFGGGSGGSGVTPEPTTITTPQWVDIYAAPFVIVTDSANSVGASTTTVGAFFAIMHLRAQYTLSNSFVLDCGLLFPPPLTGLVPQNVWGNTSNDFSTINGVVTKDFLSGYIRGAIQWGIGFITADGQVLWSPHGTSIQDFQVATGLDVANGITMAPDIAPGNILAVLDSVPTQRSEDGTTFAEAGTPPEAIVNLKWEMGQSGIYVAIGAGGIMKSLDKGATWGYIRPHAGLGLTWPATADGKAIDFKSAAPSVLYGRPFADLLATTTSHFYRLQTGNKWVAQTSTGNVGNSQLTQYNDTGLVVFNNNFNGIGLSTDFGATFATKTLAGVETHGQAVDGRIWIGTDDDAGNLRVYYTDDHGTTFTQSLYISGSINNDMGNVFCNPLDANKLMVTYRNTSQKLACQYTVDRGATWSGEIVIDATHTISDLGMGSPGAYLSSTSVVVAQHFSDGNTYIFRSTDSGATWSQRTFTAASSTPTRVLACGTTGAAFVYMKRSGVNVIFKSIDQGQTWWSLDSPVPTSSATITDWCYHSSTGTLVIVYSDRRVYRVDSALTAALSPSSAWLPNFVQMDSLPAGTPQAIVNFAELF